MERRERNEWIEKNPKEEARPARARCPWCNSGNAQVKNGIFYCKRCSYQCDISTPPEICVIGWTTANDHAYLESHCSTEEIYRAIVNEIKEKGYSFDWMAHQSNNLPCTPIINNGYKICCSPGTWGAIMADAHGADPEDKCAGAEYSFLLLSDEKCVYPEKHIDYQSLIPFEVEDR